MRLKRFGTKITNEVLKVIDSIEYEEKDESNLKRYIKIYLDNDYPIEILKKQWPDILSKLKPRDSSSLESFEIKFGKELGKTLFDEKTKKTTMTKADYITKYGQRLANEKLSSRGASLKNYIKRHGRQLGKKKWDEYCKKRNNAYARGRKENKYASRDLSWFIEKYGDVEGYAVWDKKRKSRAYKISREYLETIYDSDEVDRILRQRHSRGIDFYISKYGEIEGVKRYRQAIYRSQANKKTKSYSKWAMGICHIIKKEIPDLIYYGDNELILGLNREQEEFYGQKIIIPDLFYRGKIIEFNGDLFHGNPVLFEDYECPHPYRPNHTAQELREIDQKRYKYYEDRGYQLLVIWENDYKTDKRKTIKQCLDFLK